MTKFNFKAAIVRSGSRSTSESEPLMKLKSSINSFSLNKTAMALLGVAEGERVMLFDTYGQTELDNIDDRFYICAAGYKINGVEQGAAINTKSNSFSYSAMYTTMLINDVDVAGVTLVELEEKGLVASRVNVEGKKTYIANKSITYKLLPVGDGEEVEVADDEARVLFQLVYVREEAHSPRINSNDITEGD